MSMLVGLRVLNTRPHGQHLALSRAIHDAGGEAIPLPVLAIEPTGNTWLNHLPPLEDINHVIFISANAIDYFFEAIHHRHESWPDSIETTVIGKASARALSAWNIRVDHLPSVADSDHLTQLDFLQDLKNQTVLLIKGEGGRNIIANQLKSRGGNVITLDVYRRVLPKIPKEHVESLWQEDRVDIILLTSQQAIHNLFTLFGEHARQWLCSKPCIVISDRLGKAASALGMRTILVSPYDSIVKTLEDYSSRRKT